MVIFHSYVSVYQRFIVDFPPKSGTKRTIFCLPFLAGEVWRQGTAGEVSATKFKGDSFGQSCDVPSFGDSERGAVEVTHGYNHGYKPPQVGT